MTSSAAGSRVPWHRRPELRPCPHRRAASPRRPGPSRSRVRRSSRNDRAANGFRLATSRCAPAIAQTVEDREQRAPARPGPRDRCRRSPRGRVRRGRRISPAASPAVPHEQRRAAARLDRRDGRSQQMRLAGPGRAPEQHAGLAGLARRERLDARPAPRRCHRERNCRTRAARAPRGRRRVVRSRQEAARAGFAAGAVANPVRLGSARTLPRRRRLTQATGPRLHAYWPAGSNRGRHPFRAPASTPMTSPHPAPSSRLSYRDSGVDIDAGDALVERIKPYAARTMRPEVLAGIGGFGALVELAETLPGAGAGLRHRRRRHQAEARLRARPARHDRHRPRRDERQRHPGAGRRAALLPRLLRVRAPRRRRRDRCR